VITINNLEDKVIFGWILTRNQKKKNA
jgi:hypothetical protein